MWIATGLVVALLFALIVMVALDTPDQSRVPVPVPIRIDDDRR
jgi:hypothetical protein